MTSYTDNTYWIAIAHLPGWRIEQINNAILFNLHNKGLGLNEFFSLDKQGWMELYGFSTKELSDIEQVKNELPRLAFISEQLQNEGFYLLNIYSSEYPLVLKENLGSSNCPPLLYLKGRRALLEEDAVAIVGSRNAGEKALDFTQNIAKKVVGELKVVVSGFAKGVDKQALDTTLSENGKSIIVLPQGILTFQSGYKKYYEPIINGSVLVLSTFFPKAGWDVGLAMARNTYIYGLAKEIYVAETDSKGGTWEGAVNGLKRKRNIYVRLPGPTENNANNKLISLGALAVDMLGNSLQIPVSKPDNIILFNTNKTDENFDNKDYVRTDKWKNALIELLKSGSYSVREIKLALKLDIDSRKLSSLLKKNPDIASIKGNPVKFYLKTQINPTLFD
ncbi:MAG: DNA-protecting protein DprA [Bacteroidales bacterium]|nr:DNA-protecting protein DprA [Bacteroidales bacterium]